MRIYLYGKRLKEPLLRFNYSSATAIDAYSKRGLSRFGPYDQALLEKNEINCIILYIERYIKEKNILIKVIQEGEENFDGFQSLFKIPLKFVDSIPVKEDAKEIKIQLEKIACENPDFVYIILPKNSDFYVLSKTILLGNGIPNQVLIAEKISRSYGRQYYFENVSLATYAKVGGTPWVTTRAYETKPLMIGVSRAQDRDRSYFVGFVTMFTCDGDFIFMNSKAPVIKWEDYVNGLTTLVEDSIIEFQREIYDPEHLIFHFHKNPGRREFKAIVTALKNLNLDIPYGLIHINEYSNYCLFDTSHITYVPPARIVVNLSKREALMLLDGRIGDRRRRMGVPNILDIRMDKRSTLETELFPDIIEQIKDFSALNWRGFNAAKIPVTINYSKLIARMIAQIGINNWNQIVAQGKLRNKAWFL